MNTTISDVKPPIGRLDSPNLASTRVLALFSFDNPGSEIGDHVAQVASALVARDRRVHLFTRVPFPVVPGVQGTAVGESPGDLIEQAQDFTRRAGNAFLEMFPSTVSADVIGYDWTSAGILSLLKGLRNQSGLLSIHSLECRRSDLSTEIARRIHDLECEALRTAHTLLFHDAGIAETARLAVPSCAERLSTARQLFDTRPFEGEIDPGSVKARYDIAPLDPILVYVGDVEEKYGPDLIVKAMPSLLRHYPNAKLLLIGDGSQFWPLNIYTRYLHLEYAVKLFGSMTGDVLHELIRAADLIIVPSRESTPWWPILAGWAAKRPVVATHEAARGLLEHEKDSVLVHPRENSIVWGVEHVLSDESVRTSIGTAGRAKLNDRFGWNALADQVMELVGKHDAPTNQRR